MGASFRRCCTVSIVPQVCILNAIYILYFQHSLQNPLVILLLLEGNWRCYVALVLLKWCWFVPPEVCPVSIPTPPGSYTVTGLDLGFFQVLDFPHSLTVPCKYSVTSLLLHMRPTDNLFYLVLASYEVLGEPSQSWLVWFLQCSAINDLGVQVSCYCLPYCSSGLAYLVFSLLLFLLVFVSLLTGYPYKPRYYSQGIPRETIQVDWSVEFKMSVF